MKEKFESSTENQNNTASEWDNLAERSEQEKQGRFSRIGKKITEIFRRLYRPKDELSVPQRNSDTMDVENVSSLDLASETNSEVTSPNDVPNEIDDAQSFDDLIDFDIMTNDDHNAYYRFKRKSSSGEKPFRQAERAQELYEREINKLFTPMDELISILDNGIEGSSKRVEDYNGQKITIYDTGNLDFYYLQHDLEYNKGGARIVSDPSLWNLNKSDAKAAGLTSNLLSMQLYNSKDKHSDNGISFGILHLPPNSINMVTKSAGLKLRNDSGISDLAWKNSFPNAKDIPNEATSYFDRFIETQAFRYNDKGEPIFRPDFIIAPSEGLNEDTLNNTLKQAAYFGVPVFCIPKIRD